MLATLKRTATHGFAAAVSLIVASGAAVASGDRLDGQAQSVVPVFVLADDRFTTFDPPGLQANELVDLNSRGQVAGTYIDESDVNHGFLRDKRGRITRFDYPGATATFVNKINDHGQIIGAAKLGDNDETAARRAYLREPNGRFRTIRVPGGAVTQAIGIDSRGRIVGDYLDADGIYHGYRWNNGRVKTFDGPEGTGATITGINDHGQMVGVYQPAGSTRLQGFLLERGVYHTFNDPDLAFTVPLDIDNRGRIVGFSTDSLPLPGATAVHGFVLKQGPDGPLTTIDVPGAPATLASGIDNRGRIAGFYLNPNATPRAQRAGAEPLNALTDTLARVVDARPTVGVRIGRR